MQTFSDDRDNWFPAAPSLRRPGNWPEGVPPSSEWPMPAPPRAMSVAGLWLLFTAIVYLAAAIGGGWFLLTF